MVKSSRVFLLTAAIVVSLVNPLLGVFYAPDVQVKVDNRKTIELDIRFSVPEFTTIQTEEGNVSVCRYGVEETRELPAFGWWLVLPDGEAEIEIIDQESSTVNLQYPLASGNSHFSQSQHNDNRPKQPVKLGATTTMRGLTLAPLVVNPVSSTSCENVVEVVERLHFQINFSQIRDCSGIGNRTYGCSPGFQRMIESIVLNPPQRDQEGISQRGYNEYYLFVMMDDDDVLRTVQPLVDWKLQTGNRSEVMLVPDHRDAEEIMQLIQSAWDELVENEQHPFDYLVLVGSEDDDEISLDAYPSPRGNLRHFDMQYALLEGDDLLPECALSRLRAENIEQLEAVVSRIVSYERSPNLEDDWLDCAGVVEEQQMGGWRRSVHDASLYLRDALSRCGYDQVVFDDAVEPNTAGDVLAGHINNGTGFIAARATAEQMWDVDWLNENLESNGLMPFMMIYGADPDRIMQPLVSLGSLDEPKGIVGGSFNWDSPRTADNNTLACYMCRALTVDRLSTGYARVATHLNYMVVNYHVPQYWRRFLADHTLYGDPGLKPWVGRPVELRVNHPEAISRNATYMRIEAVAVDERISTEGVIVCIMEKHGGEIVQSVSTINADGFTDLVIRGELAEGVQLTLAGEGFVPYTAEIPIERELVDVVIEEVIVNDENGNQDGLVNPGEPVEFSAVIRNNNNREITQPVMEVSLISGEFDFEIADIEIPDIGPGESVETGIWQGIAFDNLDNTVSLQFLLSLESDQGPWTGIVEVDPGAPNLVLEDLGGAQVVDSVATFSPEIRNTGAVLTPPLQATLIPLEDELIVIQNRTDYDPIDPGESAVPAGDDFIVMCNSFKVPGQQIPMRLVLEGENYHDEILLNVQSGRVDTDTPFGPDAYGYNCFDDTDERWDTAPEFEWFEIDPEHWDAIFDGIPLDVEEQRVVNLGFTFQYYGREFDQLTISEFGWVALGDQEEYRTYSIGPMKNLAGAPAYMIAPLWTNEAWDEIFYYYEDNWGCFMVEWINEWTRFELILYDPEVWPTFTGDGGILMQYTDQVIDADYSVGISGPDPGDGLTYMYRADYHPGAAPIDERRTVFFTTGIMFDDSQVIAGHVYDSETEDPLDGVVIYSQYGFCISTNEQGWFYLRTHFDPIELRFTKQGYIDTALVIDDLGQEDTLYIDVPMERVDFDLDPGEISRELAVGSQSEDVIRINNTAPGRIEWESTLWLPGEVFPNAEPFDSLFGWDVSGITRNRGIRGIERIGELFYVCASGLGGEPPGLIYVFDDEGNLVRTFTQPNDNDPSGFYDLATDGEMLIGGDGDEIVMVNPLSGEETGRFQSAFNRSICLAYDPVSSRLYSAEDDWNQIVVSEWRGENLEQVDAFELENPWIPQEVDWMMIRGLAWFADDPHGCNLYVLHRNHVEGDDEIYNLVSKVNVNNYRMSTVTMFETIEEADRHSLVIFDSWYPAVQNLACIIHEDGSVSTNLYWLGLDHSWIDIDPAAGLIEPESHQAVTLQMDATNLQELVYNLDLCFEARGGIVKRIPLRLAVGNAGASSGDTGVPEEFSLGMPYPNPFNSSVTIPYALPVSAEVSLELFDLSGRLVRTYSQGWLSCGRYRAVLDAGGWSSGIFILRLKAGEFEQTAKLIAIK